MQDSVYLVNAGNDPGMAGIANDKSFPALGILALGTWLRTNIPYLEVICRDGGALTQAEILADIQRRKPGIVGVSVLATSYQNALEIAQCAKDCGATTIFGNDQASQLSRRIIERRPYVDYVVGSEYGERALELLVRSLQGEPIELETIPDITFRKNGEVRGFNIEQDRSLLSIVRSPLYVVHDRKTALDIFPVVDRSLYPQEHWETYLKNYMERFSWLHQSEQVTGVTTMNRARGCSRAKDTTKCNFCDMLLDISFSSPKIFWKEVQQAHAQVKANIFYEVCDSFSSFPQLIDGIVKAKPRLDFNPRFFVYAQALDLVRNPQLVEQFKDMGVFRLNIGLEAGSDVTLKHMKGPYDSVENNYAALQMLKGAGIHVYGSLVIGSDAETPQTLNDTVAWAKRIMDERLIADIEVQPILPLPRNQQGMKLQLSGLLPAEMQNTDWPWDVDKLSEIYIDNFSCVQFIDALKASIEIREYAREKRISFGSGTLHAQKYKETK